MALQQFFDVLVDFKTKKVGWRPVIGSSTLRDKHNKTSIVYFFKRIR